MRRQYHSRDTSNGNHVLDIHRLIELSRELPIIEVNVNQILENENAFWSPDSGQSLSVKDVALHAKLINETDLQYPIILCSDGRLMDGMHRVCKAWIEGNEFIKAVQFSETPDPDFVNVNVDELSYEEPR